MIWPWKSFVEDVIDSFLNYTNICLLIEKNFIPFNDINLFLDFPDNLLRPENIQNYLEIAEKKDDILL